MKELKSTLIHSIEFVCVLIAAFLIMTFFKINSEGSVLITGTIISAFVKFARVSPEVPIDDYVNPKQ